MTKTQNLAIIGCNGSIGRQTLSVVDAHPDLFNVTALCADRDADAVKILQRKYSPEFTAMNDESAAERIGAHAGMEAIIASATLPNVDTVVIAMTGMEAIFPLRAALKAGKRVALANKESIVCGGALLSKEFEEHRGNVFPVDSEHSAIFQCINGLASRDELSGIILTASGGPFRNYSIEQLREVTVEDALKHPSWSMGRKITIDCSTLANKGLEVIEGSYLFGIGADDIEVLIHPTSTVHSFIRTVDGAVMAQLGVPDMRLPIQYALTWPHRIPSPVKKLELKDMLKLEFFEPDTTRFPSLAYAYDALRVGGTATAVYNAANEAAVELFMEGRIGYTDIPTAIHSALCAINTCVPTEFEEVLDADRRAREHVYSTYMR